MDGIVKNMTSFVPTSYASLCLLDTDIVEPELLVRNIAENVCEAYPECFQGETAMVFFRIRYTPPYEKFTELKRLILQIRQATGIRSRFRGMVCIDASEYRGHEEEEYFTVLLKYLYDNSGNDAVVFVCSQYSELEIKRLTGICMKYYSVHRETLLFFKEDRLNEVIRSVCERANISVNAEGLKLIAEAMASPALVPFRSLQLINRIPEEFCVFACNADHNNELCRIDNMDYKRKGMSKLTVETVIDYFSNEKSTICTLAGSALLQKRRTDIEHML